MVEKHEYYDSDMKMFEQLYAKLQDGSFTDSDCDSFGHVMRSIERPRAIELLREVIEAHPQVGDTYIYLGKNLLHAGAVDEAIASFEKAASIDLYFGSQGYRELVEFFSERGDKSNALRFEELKKQADALCKEWKNFDYDDDGKLIIVDEPIVPEIY